MPQTTPPTPGGEEERFEALWVNVVTGQAQTNQFVAHLELEKEVGTFEGSFRARAHAELGGGILDDEGPFALKLNPGEIIGPGRGFRPGDVNLASQSGARGSRGQLPARKQVEPGAGLSGPGPLSGGDALAGGYS